MLAHALGGYLDATRNNVIAKKRNRFPLAKSETSKPR